MIWKYAMGLFMAAVIIASFLLVPPTQGLGDMGRIIVYHVPTAWVAVLAYLMSMVHSVAFLRTGDMLRDRKAAIAAGLGTLFCVLATVTGAIWARGAWGMFWNWDPRQTSVFLLLMLYVAYFALRASVQDPDRRAKLAAVYAILAFLTVPFLVFVVPRVYPTLHPNLINVTERRYEMDSIIRLVFLSSVVAFTGLYLWMFDLRLRAENILDQLERERGN
ncbi:MAG: cytochrome c biogenesis protein CcsA [Peptococcaceae bacterium]|nr:cytochrome c biogenesis protein CcsA [Peptococcaceae bacterium]